MNERLLKKVEKELERHQLVIEEIANMRVQMLVKLWTKTRKGKLALLFGMGTMAAVFEGNDLDQYSGRGWPKILVDLDKDLDEITDGYRRGCPHNVVIHGSK